MAQKIHFITYGDSKKYSISKKHLVHLAKISGFFNSYKAFSKKDLDIEFSKKYQDILKLPRGGGYFIWKPRILFNTLKNLGQDDILVYTDAGSSFNIFAKKRFFEYLEMVNDSEYGNFRIENPKQLVECNWTTEELFKYFNIEQESKIRNSPQLLGGHLIFQNNKHSHEIFEEFFKLLDYDRMLITDYYNKNQINSFVDNRHDQSIFSLLSKKFGGVIIKNETFFEKNSTIQQNFPFLSVRNYGHGKKDRFKFYINYKNCKNRPIYF